MALRVTVGDRCQRCLEVGQRFDAVDLAGLDQRGDAAPGDATFVMTGEEGAHSTEVGHLFHAKVGTRSTASWAAIPREGGRLI